MVTYRCPYCHTNRANEDKYHAGRCENCGGALEAIGGVFVVPPGYPLDGFEYKPWYRLGIESTTGTLNTTMNTVNIVMNHSTPGIAREISEEFMRLLGTNSTNGF